MDNIIEVRKRLNITYLKYFLYTFFIGFAAAFAGYYILKRTGLGEKHLFICFILLGLLMNIAAYKTINIILICENRFLYKLREYTPIAGIIAYGICYIISLIILLGNNIRPYGFFGILLGAVLSLILCVVVGYLAKYFFQHTSEMGKIFNYNSLLMYYCEEYEKTICEYNKSAENHNNLNGKISDINSRLGLKPHKYKALYDMEKIEEIRSVPYYDTANIHIFKCEYVYGYYKSIDAFIKFINKKINKAQTQITYVNSEVEKKGPAVDEIKRTADFENLPNITEKTKQIFTDSAKEEMKALKKRTAAEKRIKPISKKPQN